MLGGNREQARVVFSILEIIEAALRLALGEHGVEERLAPDRQLTGDPRGILVIRVTQGMRAIGFDIPLNVPKVLVGDGIGKSQLAGAVVVRTEANDHMVGVRKAEVQFGGHDVATGWMGGVLGQTELVFCGFLPSFVAESSTSEGKSRFMRSILAGAGQVSSRKRGQNPLLLNV